MLSCLGSCLSSFFPATSDPSPGQFSQCALVSTEPGPPSLPPSLSSLYVPVLTCCGRGALLTFSSGSPGYGSQTGGELPFAKLDNRPGSLSEDWRGSSTCCSWRRAKPALPSSGKERPGCSRSWQVAELGVDRRAGVRAAHWLPQAHTPPASLACGSLASSCLSSCF